MIADFITEAHAQHGHSVDEVKSYFQLVLASSVMGRPFMVAPRVPPERVEALRKAFVDMVKDPDFLADAEKQRRDIDLVTGEEIQDIVAQMAAAPGSVRESLEALMQFQGTEEQSPR